MESFERLNDFENHALNTLPKSVLAFYSYSAGDGDTVRNTKEAFRRIRILPRVLRDVSKRDISTTVLGEKVSMPVGISPTANHTWAHPSGECATAKAAQGAGTIFITSALSDKSIQEITQAAPAGIKWCQLSIYKDRDCAAHIIRTVEKAGYKAIVVTVDNPISLSSKYKGIFKANLNRSCALFADYYSSKKSKEDIDDLWQHLKRHTDDSLTWQDIEWVKSITKLPIVLKGILSPEDALLAVKHGVNAIVVSNHGGRQIDGIVATIEALPGIVKAVGEKVEIYVDSGFRTGVDVFKALALGAKMVFIGRPILWGLACGGENGARAVLEIMRGEIDETFAVTEELFEEEQGKMFNWKVKLGSSKRLGLITGSSVLFS